MSCVHFARMSALPLQCSCFLFTACGWFLNCLCCLSWPYSIALTQAVCSGCCFGSVAPHMKKTTTTLCMIEEHWAWKKTHWHESSSGCCWWYCPAVFRMLLTGMFYANVSCTDAFDVILWYLEQNYRTGPLQYNALFFFFFFPSNASFDTMEIEAC